MRNGLADPLRSVGIVILSQKQRNARIANPLLMPYTIWRYGAAVKKGSRYTRILRDFVYKVFVESLCKNYSFVVFHWFICLKGSESIPTTDLQV